jgi:geranylgeranyl pyrophosphate synthase
LLADVIAIVADSGGIDYARQRGEQFAHDAEQALRVLPMTPVRSALTDAIAYVMDRRF